MSTRCQIEWIWDKEKCLTYRHSDGYPDGVVPDLLEYLKWMGFRADDLEYCVATWFYFTKRYYEQEFLKGKRWNSDEVAHDCNSIVKLGYGVCADKQLHGDIEYFYEVDLKKREIRAYNVNNRFTDKVKRTDFDLIKTTSFSYIDPLQGMS